MDALLNRLYVSLLLGSVSLSVPSTYAQQCGTEIPPDGVEVIQQRMALNLYEHEPAVELSAVTIRIKWHVVTTSTGTRCIDDATLAYYLNGLSMAFARVDMSFCADEEVHLIVDDGLFDNVPSHYDLRLMEPTLDAIDIYWCPSILNGSLCGTSSYTFGPPIQGIAIQTSCMGYTDMLGVLIHEVGHYFDLFHTHEMNFGIECPTGGDCTKAGDLLCDTPPSSSLMFDTCVNPLDCSFTGDAACLQSVPYCGEETYEVSGLRNYMSYTAIPCLREFTTGQLLRARAAFDNFRPELQGVPCAPLPNCISDINGDGVVNGSDLALLLNSWGGWDVDADLNNDGAVDGFDLSLMLSKWNTCD